MNDNNVSSFQQLINEHDLLSYAARQLSGVLDPDKPRGARAIELRDSFRELLHEHLAHEDRDVYPHLLACADRATSDIAAKFIHAFEVLTADWQGYLARWPSAVTDADWPTFCRDSVKIVARLQQRIAEENALLYPTALGASVITLRAPARA